METIDQIHRRGFFVRSAALLASGTFGLNFMPNDAFGTGLSFDERENVIGPRDGFSPNIGTLLSMMTWMRTVILWPVKDMTQEQLDYLYDDKSNTIGAMLLHLAATERFYQIHTFDGKNWGD